MLNTIFVSPLKPSTFSFFHFMLNFSSFEILFFLELHKYEWIKKVPLGLRRKMHSCLVKISWRNENLLFCFVKITLLIQVVFICFTNFQNSRNEKKNIFFSKFYVNKTFFTVPHQRGKCFNKSFFYSVLKHAFVCFRLRCCSFQWLR